MRTPDTVVIDHHGSIFVLNKGPSNGASVVRIYTHTGMTDFYLDAEDTVEVIEFLKSVLAADSEKRLRGSDNDG